MPGCGAEQSASPKRKLTGNRENARKIAAPDDFGGHIALMLPPGTLSQRGTINAVSGTRRLSGRQPFAVGRSRSGIIGPV
jgi:hypothetical protein